MTDTKEIWIKFGYEKAMQEQKTKVEKLKEWAKKENRIVLLKKIDAIFKDNHNQAHQRDGSKTPDKIISNRSKMPSGSDNQICECGHTKERHLKGFCATEYNWCPCNHFTPRKGEEEK